MVLFARSEYERGLSFDSINNFRDFLYCDYKKAWNGLAPFERSEIVIKDTDHENRKRVGLSRFLSTTYSEPLWIGFCDIGDDNTLNEILEKRKGSGYGQLRRRSGVSNTIIYNKE